MMSEIWQKKSKLTYSSDVVDIILFGSSVLDGPNPNDIDVAVIFNKIEVKKQLEESLRIKRQIEKLVSLPVHIKSFDYYSIFDKGNFSKEGILFYGKSLINNKYFSENFGLIPKLRISYSLIGLEKKDKIKFNYLLNGKGGNYGLLRKYGGKILSPGLIEIKPEHELIFLKEMKKLSSKVEVHKNFELKE